MYQIVHYPMTLLESNQVFQLPNYYNFVNIFLDELDNPVFVYLRGNDKPTHTVKLHILEAFEEVDPTWAYVTTLFPKDVAFYIFRETENGI